jgi:hypothetical protein
MPCKECDNGLWRWGETGECRYESLSECEEDNKDYYNESKLNSKAFSHAKSLIEEGKVDENSDWSFSSDDGNELLGDDGDDWSNYEKWFLLINEDAAEETKERYKFPYGKNDKVYRKGLTAIRQRAAQFGYDDVFEAAGKLIDMIDKKEDDSIEDKIKNSNLFGNYDHSFHFTEEMMKDLHDDGELVVTVEEDEKKMVIRFTYDVDNHEEDDVMQAAKELKEITNKYKNLFNGN